MEAQNLICCLVFLLRDIFQQSDEERAIHDRLAHLAELEHVLEDRLEGLNHKEKEIEQRLEAVDSSNRVTVPLSSSRSSRLNDNVMLDGVERDYDDTGFNEFVMERERDRHRDRVYSNDRVQYSNSNNVVDRYGNIVEPLYDNRVSSLERDYVNDERVNGYYNRDLDGGYSEPPYGNNQMYDRARTVDRDINDRPIDRDYSHDRTIDRPYDGRSSRPGFNNDSFRSNTFIDRPNSNNVDRYARTSSSSRRNQRTYDNMRSANTYVDPNLSSIDRVWESSKPNTIQGGSLLTWSYANPAVQRLHVLLKSDGRPIDATIELWQGPDNAPQKMKVYVEDGARQTFSTFIETPGSPKTVAIKNRGQLEFPIHANVSPDKGLGDECLSMALRGPTTVIQGGALRTFAFDAFVESVAVLIRTDGRPLNARIELLQGPNNNKQVLELHTEDGVTRPFLAIIQTPGSGNVIRIVNTGPLEFPMQASVEEFEYTNTDAYYNDGVQMGHDTWSPRR
jgi:hypothetical protein